jgi:nucleoid-associated protein YgaU
MAVATRDLGFGQLAPGPQPPWDRSRPRLRVVRPQQRTRPRSAAVYVRRRIAVAALAFGVVAGVVAISAQLLAPPAVTGRPTVPVTAPVADPAPATVLVEAGDTLWDLVGPLAPEGASRHEWIARVTQLNDLDPLRLAPGTVIRLPRR